MRFRIGINLGDVMVEGDDLFGEGVNIAARLEALAEPGGILISGAVFDQVRTKLALGFDFLGAQAVKNISEPVPAWRVVLEGEGGSSFSHGEKVPPKGRMRGYCTRPVGNQMAPHTLARRLRRHPLPMGEGRAPWQPRAATAHHGSGFAVRSLSPRC